MTLTESIKDIMKLIEEAKTICSSHPNCNKECLFYTDNDDLSLCIFENPPIVW